MYRDSGVSVEESQNVVLDAVFRGYRITEIEQRRDRAERPLLLVFRHVRSEPFVPVPFQVGGFLRKDAIP